MAQVTRQLSDGTSATLAQHDSLDLITAAFCRTINKMKRQGWRETRRFFDGAPRTGSATVFFSDGDGATASVTLSGR